jgi:anti-sigma regulatory factor (Ser/Thr protein kinase)
MQTTLIAGMGLVIMWWVGLKTTPRWLGGLAAGLIVGGALGNGVEKVLLGSGVVDWFWFHGQAANLADLALVTGFVMLAVRWIVFTPTVQLPEWMRFGRERTPSTVFEVHRPEDLESFAVSREGLIRLPAWRSWYAKPGFIGIIDAFSMRLAKGLLAHVPAGLTRHDLTDVWSAIHEITWNALIHGTRFVKTRRAMVSVRWQVTAETLTVLIEDRGRQPFWSLPPTFDDALRSDLLQRLKQQEVFGKGEALHLLHRWVDEAHYEFVYDAKGRKVGLRWYLTWHLNDRPLPPVIPMLPPLRPMAGASGDDVEDRALEQSVLGVPIKLTQLVQDTADQLAAHEEIASSE